MVLITCSYNDTEFVRVGYYVNNEYDAEEMRLEPPEVPQPERVLRTILGDKPRVTRFPIKWDDILDETAKKAEDEALDRDADANYQPPSSGAMDEDGASADDAERGSESCEDEMAGADDASDEFTSQLGPEEQDRMSMMIDGETENVAAGPSHINGTAPSFPQSALKLAPVGFDGDAMAL